MPTFCLTMKTLQDLHSWIFVNIHLNIFIWTGYWIFCFYILGNKLFLTNSSIKFYLPLIIVLQENFSSRRWVTFLTHPALAKIAKNPPSNTLGGNFFSWLITFLTHRISNEAFTHRRSVINCSKLWMLRRRGSGGWRSWSLINLSRRYDASYVAHGEVNRKTFIVSRGCWTTKKRSRIGMLVVERTCTPAACAYELLKIRGHPECTWNRVDRPGESLARR